MNKRQKKVFNQLKTKFKALGFNRTELESVASEIDSNLELEDDASEEDENAAIEKAVNAAEPLLKLVQSVSQRTIQESLKKQKQKSHDENDDDDDDDDDNIDEDDDDDNKKSKKGGKKNHAGKSKEDDFAALIEKITKPLTEKLDSLSSTIDGLKGEKLKDTRRNKLEKLVKDTGTFGTSTLRNFSKMSFKDEDEFQDYLDEVESDLDAFNQERANKGLEKLGTPPKTKHNEKKDEPEVMDDNAVIALAGGHPETTNK